MNALATIERQQFDTHVNGGTLLRLSRYLGADLREFIPCRPGTKVPLVRGFNRPHYATNWDRVLQGGDRDLNVAMLFGRQSRFFGVDCDTAAAVNFVAESIARSPFVTTARGTLFLAKSDDDIWRLTSSGVLKFRLNGTDAGEIRLQRSYSVLTGRHPTGIEYELHADSAPPIIDLKTFLAELRLRGMEVGQLLPSAPHDGRDEASKASSDASFWCHEAAFHAANAPARADGTAGTDRFVITMTTALRTRPELAGVVVSVFTQAVLERGLTVRGGVDRLTKELTTRLTLWSKTYGQRATHHSLTRYLNPPETEQDTQHVLVRFCGGTRGAGRLS